MTGIDRLRAIAGAWDEWGLGGTLAETADEIERERAEDCYRMGIDCGTVLRVVADMEHHILGYEGMEDSPVARWARELRGALKSDTSDGSDAQNPSCVDAAEAADVTSDAPKVTRDPAEDVSMSAYDLLPADEREAIAWVREHGGLERVKKLLDWVVGHCSTKQQLDFDFWLSGRVMHELGFEEDMANREEVERRLLARLMPEGYEWPRFESGELVGFGDEASRIGEDFGVSVICLYSDGSYALNFRAYSKGERVKRPAVLAADGEPLEVGRTVWRITDGTSATVERLNGATGFIDSDGTPFEARYFTHQRPVLDADGVPIKEGDTVWFVGGGEPAEVAYTIEADASHPDEVVLKGYEDDWPVNAAKLTHTKPEPPDSWDALWDDIEDCAVGYESFMRRCRALAEQMADWGKA